MVFQKGQKPWNKKSDPGVEVEPVRPKQTALIEIRDNKVWLLFPIPISEQAYMRLIEVAQGRGRPMDEILYDALNYIVDQGLF